MKQGLKFQTDCGSKKKSQITFSQSHACPPLNLPDKEVTRDYSFIESVCK